MAVTRRPQQSWIDAAARREAARAAFYDRPDEIVLADLARLDHLLMVQARYSFARTMADNPHSYTHRRQWTWDGGDADFVWTVETIRQICDRERWPDAPGGRLWDVLNRGGRKYWVAGTLGNGGPVNFTDGRWCTWLINRKPVLPSDAGAEPPLVEAVGSGMGGREAPRR